MLRAVYGSLVSCRAAATPRSNYSLRPNRTQGLRDKECSAREKTVGSRPVSRVLWPCGGQARRKADSHSSGPAVTHRLKPPTRRLGRAGHGALSDTAPAYLVLLRMEVASFHPRRCSAGTRLCGPLRHVAVPGRYPASCSAEPGLSSVLAHSGCLADSRCNFTAAGGPYEVVTARR